ncbi:hypothetical protein EJB05_56849 [Eragrostis curvula]|uniref:Uncharacterized protein n=1 Tax=Eragrostis curvula TaxID=38414 RepID=A0A5J9SF24_9POAL|nr:hypothetical protein EJB05_56849 [Eragrostis curvula]
MVPSSAPGPSRAKGDARLPEPSAARGTHCCDTSHQECCEFYGMYLEAFQDKTVVEKELAQAKRKINKLTSALAHVKNKYRKIKDAHAGAQKNVTSLKMKGA